MISKDSPSRRTAGRGRRIPGEPALPEAVAEDDGAGRAGTVIVRGERAAEDRPDAEGREKTGGGGDAVEPLGRPLPTRLAAMVWKAAVDRKEVDAGRQSRQVAGESSMRW